MELMWVTAEFAFETTDYETADSRGEHWRIVVTEAMAQGKTPFRVPRDRYTLRLIERGILREANPQAEQQSAEITAEAKPFSPQDIFTEKVRITKFEVKEII